MLREVYSGEEGAGLRSAGSEPVFLLREVCRV